MKDMIMDFIMLMKEVGQQEIQDKHKIILGVYLLIFIFIKLF